MKHCPCLRRYQSRKGWVTYKYSSSKRATIQLSQWYRGSTGWFTLLCNLERLPWRGETCALKNKSEYYTGKPIPGQREQHTDKMLKMMSAYSPGKCVHPKIICKIFLMAIPPHCKSQVTSGQIFDQISTVHLRLWFLLRTFSFYGENIYKCKITLAL